MNQYIHAAIFVSSITLASHADAKGPLHWAKSEVLGSSATATDIWQYPCAATWFNPLTGVTEPLTGFETRVRDRLPVSLPHLRVRVDRQTTPVVVGVQQTDPNSNTAAGDGDIAGVASPFSFAPAISGITNTFRIYVSKSATGSEAYELDFQCLYSGRRNLITDVNNRPSPNLSLLLSIQAQ